MYVVFNIVIIGLVGLIAYWWANQGVFSALLHLLCVVVAGAVALAAWEPLVVNVLLKGGGFDKYAWGVTLVGVFAVTLLVLRVATDKLAPNNVDLPHWANLVFGFPIGLAAGVITMGIVFIGAGMLQSSGEIMGYRGYGRNQRGEVVKYDGKMWVPVHELTAQLYGWLSVTTMWSSEPMRQYYPRLHWQASLLRDSYGDGKGQLALAPDQAHVQSNWQDTQNQSVAVEVRFDSGAMDYGERLTVSAAQVRLISDARGKARADVIHPNRWIQGGTVYLFDDISHYATSVSGQESATIIFIFDRLPTDFAPRFVQIKGVRYRLPNAQAMPPGLISGIAPTGNSTATATFDATARPIPGDQLKVANDIRPVRAGKNSLPAGMSEADGYLTEGFGTFRRGGLQISRNLQIKGIFEPPGTRIVWLDVSRGAACDVYDQGLRDRVGETATMAMIDESGNAYSAVGYIHEKGDDSTDLKLEPSRRIRRIDELPHLPTARTQRLRLYFRVTEGVTLQAFKVGDVTLGRCQLRAADA